MLYHSQAIQATMFCRVFPAPLNQVLNGSADIDPVSNARRVPMQSPTDSADTSSPALSERAREPGGVSLPYQPRHGSEFDAFYAGTPAWAIGPAQPAFLALADSGGLLGRVLDARFVAWRHPLLA